jgi:glycosyltransferase involved in cell wall biosynthesis
MGSKELEGIEKKYNIDGPFKKIIYIGSEYPWKNIPFLLKAFKLAAQKNKDIKLIKIGVPQLVSAREATNAIIKDLNLQDKIIFLDYVPEEDLPKIYNVSDLLFYPSLYEGFGHPLLEAMACGVPVVTSNAGSLPEISGDAAIIVSPYNLDEAVSAIDEVLNNNSLCAELIKKGIDNVKRFSWHKSAKRMVEIYKEVFYQ